MSKSTLRGLIGVVALSMVAASCGDDSSGVGGTAGGGTGGAGGPGGAGGTAGSGGSPPLVDECITEPDAGLVTTGALTAAAQVCGQSACLSLIVTLIGGGGTEADQEAAAACVRDCLVEDGSVAGVSEGCAQCYGNSSACGASAGCTQCVSPTSCACVDCLDMSGCQTELDECTGVIYEFMCTN